MQQAATEVQQLQSQTTISKSLLSSIESSLSTSKLKKVTKKIKPKGNKEVSVSFTTVSLTDLVQWLSNLYNQHQIQVTYIIMEAKSKPDQVAVKLTLR